MIKLFKTILKAGTPTAKYPFAPYEVNRDFRGKPKYQADQCIACAACCAFSGCGLHCAS